MTIIIHATPWGVCRRYYDDGGELFFSAYDRVSLAAPARGQQRVTPEDRIGSDRSGQEALRTLLAAASEKVAPIVEFRPACSTCA